MVCVVFPIFPCESHISFLNVSIFRRSVLMKPHISAAECSSSSAWNFLTHFNSFPTFPSPSCCLSPIPIPSLFISSPCLCLFPTPPSVCLTSRGSLSLVTTAQRDRGCAGECSLSSLLAAPPCLHPPPCLLPSTSPLSLGSFSPAPFFRAIHKALSNPCLSFPLLTPSPHGLWQQPVMPCASEGGGFVLCPWPYTSEIPTFCTGSTRG